MDRPTGFRVDGTSALTNVAREWADFPNNLVRIVDRLRGVTLEQAPALALIRRYDAPRALLYLDPPYLPSTRSTKSCKPGERYHTYAVEMTAPDHAELLEAVRRSRACVLLSGYPDPSYDAALPGWRRVETDARAHRNLPRREVLWINPAAQRAMPRELFPTPSEAA